MKISALTWIRRRGGGPPQAWRSGGRRVPASASLAALQESEERLGLFIEESPAALAMLDRGMRYLAASRRWKEEYGLGGIDLVGRSHYEVFPEIGEELRSVHRRALAGEVIRNEEDRFVRADGSEQWVRWEARPWRYADGEVGGIVIFSEDISGYKRAEASQRHLADVLRAMQRLNELITQEGDRDAVLSEACALLTESRGYRSGWIGLLDGSGGLRVVAESRTGLSAASLTEAFGEAGLPRCCAEALAGGNDVILHDVARECGGCLLSQGGRGGAALVGAIRHDGRSFGILAVALPLSMAVDDERDLFREVLDDLGLALSAIEGRSNRSKLEAALASMTDAVFISDAEGNFVDFNDAFATFHKFRDRSECARTLSAYPFFLDVFMPDGALARLDQWAVPRALRGEVGSNVEYALKRKDTGEEWVGSYSFSPIRGESGDIVGSVVVARDITEKKRAEDRIAQALEEKETLLRELYHRTKNNMLSIIAMMSLRASAHPEAGLADFVEDINQRILAMALVHEKLYRHKSLSRIDLGEYLAELARVSIQNAARGDEVSLSLELERVSVLIDTAMPAALAVNELLTNSLRHAFPGGRRGTIRIRLALADSGSIELEYSDDGVGIPAGFDVANQSSYGLKTALSLVFHQLRGSISLLPGPGTRYAISFRDDFYGERV
jgi:PAS domain S-box-containing protein